MPAARTGWDFFDTQGIAKLGRFEVIRQQNLGRLSRVRRGSGEAPLEHRPKVPNGTPSTLSRAVTDAVLWVGKYYYSGGITEYGKWCEIIQAEIGPEVGPYLEDAWSRTAQVEIVLANVVAELRSMPDKLSGLDSESADLWEAIKYQVRQEPFLAWPDYLGALKQVIDRAVAKLAPPELLALCSELKTPTHERAKTGEALLKRLLAKAKDGEGQI